MLLPRQICGLFRRTIGGTIFRPSVYVALNLNISKELHSTSVLTDNHYKTLGISPKSKPDEIKAAYIKLSKLYHPDKHLGQDSDKFLEISKAYKVLGNSTSRIEYDLREFCHSTDFNRFATGEYKLPDKNDPKRDVSKLRQQVNRRKSSKEDAIKQRPDGLFTVSPRIRRLLNYLYFAIFVTGCVMYYLGNKNKSNNIISKEDDIT